MRLGKYLTEMSEVDIAQYIRDNCGQWIQETRGVSNTVYRGIVVRKPNDGDVLIPRTDRKPRDTKIIDHETLDNLLNDKFGWKPRSEGVFCTGNPDRADKYGDVYAVYPLDGYKYVWSPKVPDLYVELYGLNPLIMNTFEKLLTVFMKDEVVGEYFKDKVIEKIVKTYKNTDLLKAIKSGNEIIVKCGGYVVVKKESMKRIII